MLDSKRWNSDSKTFWSQETFTFLKITEDLKKLLFMWVITLAIL